MGTNRLDFLFRFNPRAQWLENGKDTDTTKICLVYFSEKESKIGLARNKINLQKDAFPTRVVR